MKNLEVYDMENKIIIAKTERLILRRYKKTELPNKRYDYNSDDVFKLFHKGVERKTYLYARVSTPK